MHKKDITVGYVCLECCKVFKKYKCSQGKQGNWQPINYKAVCPQCNRVMYETGAAFKAPKGRDVKAWEKLKPLFESGYKFNPNFGCPFVESEPEIQEAQKVPKSEFRKPKKRSKNA